MEFTVPLVLSALGEAASRFLNSNLLKGIGALNTALSLIDRAKGLSKDEKHQTKAIVRRLGETVQARMERAGSEADRQAYLGAATSAEIVLDKLLKSKETLVQAARCDADVLLTYIDDNRGSAMRREVDQKAEGLFDDLLAIVADGLAGLAQTSQDFLRNALLVALDNQEALMELVQEHGQDLSMVRKALEEIREGASAGNELLARVSQALEIVSAGTKSGPVSEGQGRPIRFGSPPGRAAGFIGRDEQARLDAALGCLGPRAEQGEALESAAGNDAAGDSWSVGMPVVVCGMRGVGKSQLAAAYARECEKAGWSFVAWMDASSREALVAGLAGLAVEMGIDDGKGDPDAAACRCVNRLNSGEGDRLLVFDNVDDFDDLKKLIPHGQGLRVLVTTTVASPGDSAGRLIAVGAFTRPQSVDFIRERTGLDDDAGAARLAEALGDLPVALAQAAATIKLNGYATLDEYLAELREYPLDEVVDRANGEAYPAAVHAALRMAYTSVLDLLAEKDHARGEEGLPRAKAACVQLAALALLAPSGVPRPWLHRVGKSEPIARQALGALVAHSVCTLSDDGRYVRIHGLQGRVLREDYNKQPEVFASLEKAVVTMLKGIDMDKADTNDAQRADALDLADHLRAITEQQQGQAHYSPHEARINLPSVGKIMKDTIYRLTYMGRPQTSLNLTEAVKILTNDLPLDHSFSIVIKNNLARAYVDTENFKKAAELYISILDNMPQSLIDTHYNLLVRNDIGRLYLRTGASSEAVKLYKTLLEDVEQVFPYNDPKIFAVRNNLANAYQAIGEFQKSLETLGISSDDMHKIFDTSNRDVLIAINNIATTHHTAGNFREAIDIYKDLKNKQESLLGYRHPDTLITSNNLAYTYISTGRYKEAIKIYSKIFKVAENVFGTLHYTTLKIQFNFATAYEKAGNYSEATEIYEKLLKTIIEVLEVDHPLTLVTRVNLAAARKTQQASSPQADGGAESAPPPES